jgi:hypothetical protein
VVVVETTRARSSSEATWGTSFDELNSGATEGQRRVLALAAPTWLSHAPGPKIPDHGP